MAVNIKTYINCSDLPNQRLNDEDMNKITSEINNAIEDNGLVLNTGDQTQLAQVISNVGGSARYGGNVSWAETASSTTTNRVIQPNDGTILTAPIVIKDGSVIRYRPDSTKVNPGNNVDGGITITVGVNAPLPLYVVNTLGNNAPPALSFALNKFTLAYAEVVTIEYVENQPSWASGGTWPAFILKDAAPWYNPTTPSGSTILWAGNHLDNAIPPGYLICRAGTFPTADYPALYGVIGNFFGGDATNAGIPDFRDRVPVGAGATWAVGTYVGQNSIALGQAQLPWHQHNVPLPFALDKPSDATAQAQCVRGPIPTNYPSDAAGSGAPFSILQASTVMNYLIKV